MAKPSFWHDHMELRQDGRTVGRSETFAKRGEALGRTWLQTVTSLDGEAVAAEAERDTRDFRRQVSRADRVGYGLTWQDSGEEFGQFTDDQSRHAWTLSLGGKNLYWSGYSPWLGGARFRLDDSDEQTYVCGQRYPLRTTTWQKITVADELPEPEGIVAAQFGHTLWHTAALYRGPHGNTAFLASRL